MRFCLLLLALLRTISLGVPTPTPQSSADTFCGRDDYTPAELQAAADAACQYVGEGTTAGRSKYPERYNDREGFGFNGVVGPYYEFPIFANGKVYSGGSPGADRIVINAQCEIAGEITHTGASGNNFVGCSGTTKRK